MPQAKFTDCEPTDEYTLKSRTNGQWTLNAMRIEYGPDKVIMQFIQFDHPDGTNSYMRLDGEEFVAGPFGGGYSWTLPKYVVQAGFNLAVEAEAERTEPVEV